MPSDFKHCQPVQITISLINVAPLLKSYILKSCCLITSSGSWLFFLRRKANQADPHSHILIKQLTQNVYNTVNVVLEPWLLWHLFYKILSIPKSQNQQKKIIEIQRGRGRRQRKKSEVVLFQSSLTVFPISLHFIYIYINFFQRNIDSYLHEKKIIICTKKRHGAFYMNIKE